MSRIEEQIDIAAAPADVFRFCHDVTSWPDWDERVVSVELLSPRPIRRGTLLRIDAKHSGGSVFSWEAEYVGYQMPLSSKMRALDTAPTSPFAAGSEMSWEFSSSGGGTRLTWIWDYKPRGILAAVADILGRRASTHRAIRRSLANLKALIESGRRARLN